MICPVKMCKEDHNSMLNQGSLEYLQLSK